MEDNGIDDILIGASYKNVKSKGRGFKVFFIILIIILVAFFGINYYLNTIKKESPIKEQFIEQLSKTNIKSFLNNELYENMYARLLKENFEIENSINFTNSIDNFNSDYLRKIDFSKFIINLNSNRDADNDISFSEILLKYSGNDVLNFKAIQTDNNIAIYSDELYDRYVAVEYDDLNKIFGTEIDVDILKNRDRIDLTKSEIIEYYKNYKEEIISRIQEDHFSKNENYGIVKDDNEIEVTSYELSIGQDELNSMIISVLEKIKGDQTLIDKIISGKDESLILDITNDTPILQNIRINIQDDTQDEKIFSEEDLKKDLVNILLGKKINISYNNFVSRINYLIDYFKGYEGDGLKVIIYSSDKKVEKINLNISTNINIDIEFPEESSNKEKNIKITYLLKDTNNGFSVDISRTENAANQLANIVYSFIEQGTINRKININLDTEGTTSSNNMLNNIVISYLTNEGELKCSINNKIKFSVKPEIESLTSQNCLYLNELSQEEYISTVQLLYNKAISLYNEKRENLNFIDINTDRENSVTSVSIDEARTALYNKVSEMMTQAVQEGREFTIQDLNNLTIDGYDVKTNINDENAIIVVDIYMFSIDQNFYLEDIE